MNSADHIRNEIIDKLLTISDKGYLSALFQVVENSKAENTLVTLSEEQIRMLNISDEDIQAGRLISQSQLDKNDLKWLKEV